MRRLVQHRRQSLGRMPEIGETVAKRRVRPGGEKAVMVGVADGEIIGYSLARRAPNGVDEAATGVVFR